MAAGAEEAEENAKAAHLRSLKGGGAATAASCSSPKVFGREAVELLGYWQAGFG